MKTSILYALAVFLITSSALPAIAGGVVVVTDTKIPQFKQIIQGAKEVLPDLRVIEQSDIGNLDGAVPDAILAVGAPSFVLVKDKPTALIYCMVPRAMTDTVKGAVGVTFDVFPGTQLELFKQVAPSRKRIGVLYQAAVSGSLVQEATHAASSLGLTIVARELLDVKDVRAAAGEIADKIDALWLLPDPKIISGEVFRFLLSLMTEKKIPIYGFLENFTQAGALASVSPDFLEIGRQAAKLAAAAAGKHGSGTSVPSPGALSVNLKTALQLGINLPADVVSKAKLVIK